MKLPYKFPQPVLYLLSIDLRVILVIIYTEVIAEKDSRIIETFHVRLFKSPFTVNTETFNGAKV